MREKLPGLGLSALIAGLATFLASVIPGFGSVTLALLLGIAVRNTVGIGSAGPGVTFSAKKILALAVALLGSRIDAGSIAELGFGVLGVLVVVVAVPIGLAWLLRSEDKGVMRLTGVGTGICGSAAIAAAAPLVHNDDRDVGVAVGVVNLWGTLGMFALPFICSLLAFSPQQVALVLGGGLQAMGHVVGAGMGMSPEVGELAVAIKMGRVALLVPTIFILSAGGKGAKIPWDLQVFVLLAVLANLGWIPEFWLDLLGEVAKIALGVAMAGIGLRIALGPLLRQAPRVMLFGLLFWLAQLAVVFTAAWWLL